MTSIIALIRGINVGATRKLPMADLRAALAEEGFGGARTYIQSGNVLLETELDCTEVEARLEALISRRFGLDVPVIARTADEWDALVAACPMREAAEARPNIVHLCLPKCPPAADAAARLQDRARPGERIVLAGGALWIDFGDGAGSSRLSPTLIDRAAGAPVTARNWRTVTMLASMMRQT